MYFYKFVCMNFDPPLCTLYTKSRSRKIKYTIYEEGYFLASLLTGDLVIIFKNISKKLYV